MKSIENLKAKSKYYNNINLSIVYLRNFDVELSAMLVKCLNLSIVLLIGDIQVCVASYILQDSLVVGF